MQKGGETKMQNKVKKVLSVLCTVLAFGILFTGIQPVQAKEKLQALHVEDTVLCNEDGKTVQLRGVSTHGLSWYPQYVNDKCFQELHDKWGANVVRLAMYTEEYNGYCTGNSANKKELKKLVKKGVKLAEKHGMYVIIDWHILSDGNPKTYQKQALKFFTKFAKKYKGRKNILYEICNEPNGDVTWERDIRPYANKVINRIRKYDKKNIIIVGTPTWSQDVDIAAAKPLKQKNIAYALHFYARTHTDNIRQKLKTAHMMGLPVLVTEFSVCDASGNGPIDKKSGRAWQKLLNKYKIGYVAWNISNKNETSALIRANCQKTGGFTKSDLSKSGKFIVSFWKK